MLVEFTSSTSIDFGRLTNAIDRLINDEYDKGTATGDYGVLEGKRTVCMCPARIDLEGKPVPRAVSPMRGHAHWAMGEPGVH